MARHPFDESTWSLRSSLPNLDLNGVYSGIVTGLISGYYDPPSGFMLGFGKDAHHFQGFANMVAGSVNHGATWETIFNEDHDAGLNDRVVGAFSLPHPSFPSGRLHFQIRFHWTKAFLIADGSLPVAGSFGLYMSEGGFAFSRIQTFHSWGALNQIGGNGGAALFNAQPTVTRPVLLPGTGPSGEDAYWLVTAFSFDAGGAGNRTTIKACALWRSIDGGFTWENVRNMEPVFGTPLLNRLQLSTSGRLLLSHSQGAFWTDDADDLINAVWTASIFNGAITGGNIVPMHGGTWLTHSQGTLTGPGNTGISCDDGENFGPGGTSVIPQNQAGFLNKIGPSEALIVAPGFSDPITETVAEYSADGGETFLISEPWLSSGIGESPCMLELQSDGRPITLTRAARCFVSSGRSTGATQTRTICPLANSGIAAAGPLPNCGHPLHVDSCP